MEESLRVGRGGVYILRFGELRGLGMWLLVAVLGDNVTLRVVIRILPDDVMW